MNTKLRQKAKNNIEKDFFKLMKNAVFVKTMENVRKYRDIERVTTERRRNYLVSEPNYHYQITITENVLAVEVKKAQILMNKPNYLGLSILDLSKTVIYEFWYNYVKPKYGENTKLCYMDTGSFIVHVKTDDIYKDIAEDVDKRFDTSNFMIDRALPIGKNKKVIRWTNHEKMCQNKTKTYSDSKDNNDEDQKAKQTKKCVTKRNLKCRDYKKCLKASRIENKINSLEKKKN